MRARIWQMFAQTHLVESDREAGDILIRETVLGSHDLIGTFTQSDVRQRQGKSSIQTRYQARKIEFSEAHGFWVPFVVKSYLQDGRGETMFRPFRLRLY